MELTRASAADAEHVAPALLDMRAKGYSVARSVIPCEQIATLRSAVSAHFAASGKYGYGGKLQWRGLHRVEEIARLLASEPMLRLLKEYTPSKTTLLTGECDLRLNTTSVWHNDTYEMNLDPALYDDAHFAVFKAAIYLQDQDAGSPAALKVRPGSHRQAKGGALPFEPVPVRAGDVIIFDVRLEHAGQFPTLGERACHRLLCKAGRFLRMDGEIGLTRTLNLIRSLQRQTDRIGIFLTFGPQEEWTHIYQRAGWRQHGAYPSELAPEIVEKLAALNIVLMPPD